MSPTRSVVRTSVASAGILAVFAAVYAYIVLSKGWRVELAKPWMLLSLLGALVAFIAGWVVLGRRDAGPGASAPKLFVSRGSDLAKLPKSWKTRVAELPAALRVCALCLLGVALARPQRVDAPETLELSGIDIVLVMDMSGSMRAQDLQPTRLQAAKEVIDNFIVRRRTDRIGFVVFGREAFPALAPTLDYQALRQTVSAMEIGVLSEEGHAGTAIGDGLGAALNYLRRSDARSKVVVLLTDGSNNSGHLDPDHAARFAEALRVKVFTVLVGQSDEAPITTGQDFFGRPVVQTARFPMDPALLQRIATTSNGQFFRAADRGTLEQAFHSILDNLERSRIADAGVRHTELFPFVAAPALLLLALELLLSSTLLRRFP
ncbi:MAG: VWA domain-containing protein [Myxococcales bacterium]|nr:VWA domain-containing protein [Myxococcales bacterium]